MAPKQAQKGPEAEQQVMHMNPRIEKDRQMILDARKKGTGSLFKAYVKLSGPGWLQSGITLGRFIIFEPVPRRAGGLQFYVAPAAGYDSRHYYDECHCIRNPLFR